MTKLKHLPLALAALGASSPAFAHDTGFFHTHTEGLVAAIALGIAAAVGFKFFRSRQNDKTRK